jgi:hypothetical protein
MPPTGFALGDLGDERTLVEDMSMMVSRAWLTGR